MVAEVIGEEAGRLALVLMPPGGDKKPSTSRVSSSRSSAHLSRLAAPSCQDQDWLKVLGGKTCMGAGILRAILPLRLRLEELASLPLPELNRRDNVDVLLSGLLGDGIDDFLSSELDTSSA